MPVEKLQPGIQLRFLYDRRQPAAVVGLRLDQHDIVDERFIAETDQILFIADTGNNRILRFRLSTDF